jgi:hypothetical protein
MSCKHACLLFISLAFAFALGDQARGAEPPAYTVHAEASRVDGGGGGQIVVNIRLQQDDATGGGGSAKKMVIRPRLLLSDGNRASFLVGEAGLAANPAPPAALKAESKSHPEPRRTPTTSVAVAVPQQAEIVSGTKVDVISVKGQDKVLVVSMVIENRLTVWADAQTIKISPEPSKTK